MTAAEKKTQGTWNDAVSRRGELLVRLSTDPQQLATERRSLPRSVEARLSALVTEIDEIVLPRALRLYSGPQEMARLIISHRRLIDIGMPGRTATPKDSDDLPNLLAARLVEIAETRGELSLAVGRRPSHPNHAENACSVASLNQALELATTQNGFDRLLRQVAAQSFAQLLWSEKSAEPKFSGAIDWIALLKVFAGKYRMMGSVHKAEARVGPLRTEGLVIPLTAGQVLVIASLEKKGFAAILPRKVGLEVIAAWQIY